MSQDIPSAFARIQESATRLNTLCDQASESVKSLESFLARCHAGVYAAHNVWSDQTPYEDGDRLDLCYGRLGNSFRVYLSWYRLQTCPEDQYTTKAWAECKREDKLLTLPLLGKLVAAIEKAVREKEEQARSALSAIEQFSGLMDAEKDANAKSLKNGKGVKS